MSRLELVCATSEPEAPHTQSSRDCLSTLPRHTLSRDRETMHARVSTHRQPALCVSAHLLGGENRDTHETRLLRRLLGTTITIVCAEDEALRSSGFQSNKRLDRYDIPASLSR